MATFSKVAFLLLCAIIFFMIKLKKSPISGSISIPSSKSQTIRAILIATFAKGKSIIHNPLISSDTKACIDASRLLGANITFSSDNEILYIDSTNVDIKNKKVVIDTANSGTTTYLLYGMLGTLGAKEIILTGDEQLNRRPVLPLVNAYRDLGLQAELEGECPPVKISGFLRGGKTSIVCKTSQYLSSLLLSLPLAKEDSIVDCPLLYEKPYVRMTLEWLDRQNIKYSITEDLQHVEIQGRQRYKEDEVTVLGDFSSASFFFVMAAITNSTITVKGLDRNDVQGDKRILEVLEQMGCIISWDGYSVTVKGPKHLKGGSFDLNSMPDTLPILCVAALKAEEDVEFVNVQNARIKETDRISSMRENLEALGAAVIERPDGLLIKGGTKVKGAFVKGFKDHRIIMSLAVASLLCDEELTIDDESACSVTFPTFFTLFEKLKGEIK